MIHRIKTHIANYLGECRKCEHWLGVGIMAGDDEICEKSKEFCPLYGIKDNEEHLVKIVGEEE